MASFALAGAGFRTFNSVFAEDFASTGDTSYLVSIEQNLLAGHDSFCARQYDAAITSYLTAQAAIYAHLDPAALTGPLMSVEMLPRDPKLFSSLLSASLEWMNLLPVTGPAAPVTPRVAVDPALLGSASSLEQAGLSSSTLATRSALQVAADAHMITLLADQGNVAPENFFRQRAQGLDAALASSLLPSVPAPAPTPVTPIHLNPAISTRAATMTGRAALPPIVFSPPAAVVTKRQLGAVIGGKVVSVTWAASDAPPLDQVLASTYQARVTLPALTDAISHPVLPSDFALSLPHQYYYVIPLALAECHHGLQDWVAAEQLYLTAAAYQYINTAVEAPYVWLRLASLYRDWGNFLYENGDAPSALAVYQKVINPDGSVPAASALYTTSSFSGPAGLAQKFIAVIAKARTDPTQAANAGLAADPAAVILEINGQMLQIAAGLDFFGQHTDLVPIWTFDFLQQAAIGFAQLAKAVEGDVINFFDRADQARLSRLDLQQRVTQSQAAVQQAQMQLQAASDQVSAYTDAANAAAQRAADAAAQAAEYAASSSQSIQLQAESAQISGGDDGDLKTLNSWADTLLAGGRISGSRATVAAATGLAASMASRDYEVNSLKQTAAEMATAQQQANAETQMAQAQMLASSAAVTVAQLQASAAQDGLSAFNAQMFTPDVWHAMGVEMQQLYKRYMQMALRVARLMQQAYNFENDQQLSLIRTSYASSEVSGLLGADALMADIQTFTYDLITSSAGKPQLVQQTISLASNYGYAFENQLRKTGTMTFETRIDDFDTFFPGTYAGRIKELSVNVIGLVPVSNFSGTLTNNGISGYRVPADGATSLSAAPLKYRVQPKETRVLSDLPDTNETASDSRMRGVFEGCGVASSWQLSIPPEVNDIDYSALLDVTLTFVYEARYDPDLANLVIADLKTQPGVHSRLRSIPLRWLYPDLFFTLQQTGTTTLELSAGDFAHNETQLVLTSIGVQLAMQAPASADGVVISLATPANTNKIAGTADASGAIDSSAPASPWAPLAQGTALGNYTLTIDAASNPKLAPGGQLDLSALGNLAVILGYTYTPRS